MVKDVRKKGETSIGWEQINNDAERKSEGVDQLDEKNIQEKRIKWNIEEK